MLRDGIPFGICRFELFGRASESMNRYFECH
jgi:hypothetical protein